MTTSDDHDSDSPPDVTIADALCIHATERALRVIIRGRPVWIPQSVIAADSEVYAVGHRGTLVVAGWWAEREGLER